MGHSIVMSSRSSRALSRLSVHLVLGIGSIVMLFPLFWMVTTSLKTSRQLAQFPPTWIPSPVSFEGWIEVWNYMPWLRFLLNTLYIVILGIIGNLIACSLVAYGFAFFRFRGRHFLFMVLISTMLIPSIVTMVPVFVLFSKLGWVNTYKPLVVPVFFGAPTHIFLLRQFFRTIPQDLFDATRIDGAGESFILLRSCCL